MMEPVIHPTRVGRSRLRCRGSIYLTVLGSSLIVTVIGMSALAAVRIQRQVDQTNHDLAQARLLARSALELGMLQIRDDPRWRTRGEGPWFSDRPMADGRMSLTVSDPLGGGFSDPQGPAALTGEGHVGVARYRMQTQVTTTRGLGAMESAMQAGDDITFDGLTVACNQAVMANDDIEATNGAVVFGDIEAGDHISGASFMGRTAEHADRRQMPDRSTVFAYYLAQGTPISYNDLPRTGPNLLENAAMEGVVTPWVPTGYATLDVSTFNPHAGSGCLRVSDRSGWWDGPGQDIRDRVIHDMQYEAEVWVRMLAITDFVNIVVWVRDDDGDRWYAGNWQTVGTAWTRVTSAFRIRWKGTLRECRIYTATAGSNQDFYVDDMALRRVEPDGPGIRRAVLSPAVNPFGAGQTNPQGIYVLDCDGRDVRIENARIVGTLVLIDPGAGSRIAGSVHLEPARVNYPALLVSGGLTIAMDDAGLSEAAIGVNLNPPQTPFPYNDGAGGDTDGDLDDAYPSLIRGLVYASDDLTFDGRCAVEGLVIAHDDIVARGVTLTLRYQSIYLNDPPPGFDTATRNIELVAGSWRRLVD